jgi:hypothetical protein
MTARRQAGPWILAIDTATSRIVVAAGSPEGRLVHALDWPAGHRHGEQLLPGVEALLHETGLPRAELVGIVVGTGPGAFTGLRVGLATAKTMAHALELEIAGVGTGVALIRAAALDAGVDPERIVLLLPAGPHDRVEVRERRPPRLLPGGLDPELGSTDLLVAVDLAGRAPDGAVARGTAALDGLAPALIHLGSARLAAGTGDDAELLVPDYVTLPRGVRETGGEIEWSLGPR